MSSAGNASGGDSEAAALSRIRDGIDAIDDQILKLLSQRLKLVLQAGEVKRALGMTGALHRIEREEAIYARLAEASTDLTEPEIRKIFREIISCQMAREQQQRVAFLGPPGTFSQQAVQEHFGHSAATLDCGSIDDVINAVEDDRAQHGVVPLENSTRGMVDESLDALTRCDLVLTGEVLVPVQHCLMALPGTGIAGAKKIYSHSQSFAQCRNWLQKHLPEPEQELVNSNGAAAAKAAANKGTLAIAPALAADIHGLEILQPGIQDKRNNTTRFVVIGKREIPPGPGIDKTSLLISAEHKPGALLELLQIFGRRDINISSLYSRPSGLTPSSFSFFLDVNGHQQEEPLRSVLQELQQRNTLLRLFGSYPAART